ncbi:hypothetical protein [Streptomyces sp. MAR4 CNX-425]|uniref:hypothetical protein n=1 Tax=Streptomyces sp. MAR4 CNX-425 TaxID=3406343 RepID=UPI003B5120CB
MAVVDQGPAGQPAPEPPASDRHAPRRHLGAYLTAAVLLTALGRMVIVWIYYDFDYVSSDVEDFFKALYDPRVLLDPELFSPYIWAFTVALLVTGLVAALNRRAARGAALLCGFVMFATAGRELIGLASSDQFRQWYIGGNDLEFAIIASWVMVLLFSATVVVLMLRAGDRPAGGPAALPPQGSQLYALAGGLMLLLGLALVGWIVRMLTRDVGPDAGSYFKGLVDAGESPFPILAGSTEYWEAVFAVSILVVGVLALMRLPVARGAAITVLGVYLYINVRRMIGMTITDYPNEAPDERTAPVLGWDGYTETTEGMLVLATYVGGSLIAVAVIAMMLRAPEAQAGAYVPPAPGGPVPPKHAPPPAPIAVAQMPPPPASPPPAPGPGPSGPGPIG